MKYLSRLKSGTKKILKTEYVPLRMNFFVLFSFCFLLYIPKFNIPSVLFDLISYGIPITYVLLNFNMVRTFSSKQFLLLFCILILLLLSCLFPLINGTGDLSYFKVHLDSSRMLLSYIALLCLVIKKHGREKSLHYFMYYYALTHLVYVIVTVLMVCLPSIQDIWFTVVQKNSLIGSRNEYLFRVGWQGFSGFRQTLHCTFGAIFALYLRYGVKPCAIGARQFWLLFIGCAVGNMFYGRSGLILTIVVSALAIIVWNRKNMGKIFRFVCLIAGGVLAVAALKNVPFLDSWYNWMSGPVVNLISSGDFDDSSFDTLKEMNQVEVSFNTFLFGDGIYTDNGHYYMSTDAGFFRNILFWGIFGAILSYGVTLYCIFKTKEISRLLAVQLLIVFLAFEYKGAVYYEFITITFAIYLAFYTSKLKLAKQEDKRIGNIMIEEKER